MGHIYIYDSMEHFYFFKPLPFFYLVLHLWDIRNSRYIEHEFIFKKKAQSTILRINKKELSTILHINKKGRKGPPLDE